MVQCFRTGLIAALACLAVPAGAQHEGTTAGGAAIVEQAQGQRSLQSRPGDDLPLLDLSVVYTAEVLRNARGGLARGARYLDNLDVTLTVDAERAFGWRGATLFAYGLYNNGKGFSGDLVGDAQGVSNIETGVRAARLYEAWAEQRFADRASVKFGLYDLNSEFDTTESGALFLNPSHGIGPDFSQSGRNGPSIFPVTSLALRGDFRIAGNWLIRAAILDGVPGNPGRPRRTAVKLGRGDGLLTVFELNWLDDGTKAAIGYWRYTGRFENILTLQRERGGNDGLYMLLEHQLTREGRSDRQGLAGWVRLGFANERLNPIRRYLGGGLAYTGPFTGRDKDRAGIAIGWAEFGDPFRRASALGGDPLESRELIIEATYRAPVNRWLTIQPDIQYVIAPGGARTLKDALVLGLRAEIGF